MRARRVGSYCRLKWSVWCVADQIFDPAWRPTRLKMHEIAQRYLLEKSKERALEWVMVARRLMAESG